MGITDNLYALKEQPEEALETILKFDEQELNPDEELELVILLSDLVSIVNYDSNQIANLKEDGFNSEFYQTMVDGFEGLTKKLEKHALSAFKPLVEKYNSSDSNKVLSNLTNIMKGLVTASPHFAVQAYSLIPNNEEYDLLKENLMINCIGLKNQFDENDLPLLYIFWDRSAKKLDNAYAELN